MKIPEKNKRFIAINQLKEEQWSLIPYGANQYWIIHKDNGKTTFVATVEDSGSEERNRAVAIVLSKAPQLLQIVEALYEGIENTALEKTIIYYMIKKLLNEIQENEHTRSIRNT